MFLILYWFNMMKRIFYCAHNSNLIFFAFFSFTSPAIFIYLFSQHSPLNFSNFSPLKKPSFLPFSLSKNDKTSTRICKQKFTPPPVTFFDLCPHNHISIWHRKLKANVPSLRTQNVHGTNHGKKLKKGSNIIFSFLSSFCCFLSTLKTFSLNFQNEHKNIFSPRINLHFFWYQY